MAVVVDRAIVFADIGIGVATKLERAAEVIALDDACRDDVGASHDRLLRIARTVALSIHTSAILGQRGRRRAGQSAQQSANE
jgi:hypothetical protein